MLIQFILHLSEWLPMNIKHVRRFSGRQNVEQDCSLDDVGAKRLIIMRINCEEEVGEQRSHLYARDFTPW